jgi:signal transduction histidine kinase
VAAIHFEQGKVRFSRKDGLGCWRALDERMPILFAVDSRFPFETEFTSPNGLRFFNTEGKNCPEYLAKPTGAKWIDIPLLRSDESRTPLGKITVECPDDFSLEMLKYLEILAEAASACVTSLQVQEIRSEIETAAGRKLMLTVIGNTAHQLRSKLNSVLLQAQVLSTVIGKDHPDRLELVKRIETIQGVLEDVEDRFAPLLLHCKSTDFVDFARTLLLQHLEPENLFIEAPAFLQFNFDPKLIEEAIDELIENGRKAVFNKRQLQLRVSITSHSFKGKLWCRFEIEDNGDGFPKEYQNASVREYRSQWPEYERGHGLGLSRVCMIVAEHGGIFQNIRSLWGGARFRIDLPRFKEDSNKEQLR